MGEQEFLKLRVHLANLQASKTAPGIDTKRVFLLNQATLSATGVRERWVKEATLRQRPLQGEYRLYSLALTVLVPWKNWVCPLHPRGRS